MKKWADLTEAERAAAGRRLRLEWACQGDLGAVEGVLRMIAQGETTAARLARAKLVSEARRS